MKAQFGRSLLCMVPAMEKHMKCMSSSLCFLVIGIVQLRSLLIELYRALM